MNRESNNLIDLIDIVLIKDLITAKPDLEDIHPVIYSCTSAVTTLNGRKPITDGIQINRGSLLGESGL